MRSTRNRLLTAAAAVAVLGASLPATAEVPLYKAEYEVFYKGRRAGNSVFSVTHDATSGRYTFESSTRARGILRLARPNPAIDRSAFELVDGRVRPLEFRYEDGSRSGEDNVDIAFDWTAGEAHVQSESGQNSLPLEAGTLDRGTVQVALMMAAAKGHELGPYTLIDEDGSRVYGYEPRPPADADTGLGSIAADVVMQQRDGSSRSTLLWLAPSLEYLPVRIEQIRNGEIETVFVLESVEGLGTD